MSKMYILELADGTIAVMELLKGDIETEVSRSSLDISSYREVTKNQLPEDRRFRDAWVSDGTSVKECLVKSRDIIRKKRNMKLEQLDTVAFKESRKPKNNLEEVNTEAQRLRDIPEDTRFTSDKIEDLKEILDSL